ncbi:MAG TPA: hypothetical protein VM818_09210 [Vicinamibacterales bacterium]|nr:hypothetical protein [Vicinamibacterales bacterium]
MIVLTAIVSLGTFFGGFWLSGVGRIASDVLVTTRQAASTMRDDSLDEATREKVMRRSSLRLVSHMSALLIRSAAAVAAALAPILLAHAAGLVQAQRVFAFLSRWETALATTIVAGAAYWLWDRP